MPKRKNNMTPEGSARISATSKARWAANREEYLARARKGLKKALENHPGRTRPEPGTEARRLFEKIARNSNAAAAHAELARRT